MDSSHTEKLIHTLGLHAVSQRSPSILGSPNKETTKTLSEEIKKIPIFASIESKITEMDNRVKMLSDMLAGMDSLFSTSEQDAVRERIQICNAQKQNLIVEYKTKTELYADHIMRLNHMLDERQRFLSNFDQLLTVEPELAGLMVQSHHDLEEQLGKMNEVLANSV